MPKLERIIFEGCAKDAKAVGALADCVVRAMNERDRRVVQQQTTPIAPAKVTFGTVPIIPKQYPTTSRRVGPKKKLTYQEWKKKMIRPQRRTLYRRRKEKRRWKRKQRAAESQLLQFLETTKEVEPQFRTRTKRAVNDTELRARFDVHMKRILKKLPGLSSKYFQAMIENPNGEFTSKNLQNLKRIHDHFRKADICDGYFKTVVSENQKVFDSNRMGVKCKTPTPQKNEEVLNGVLNMVNAFMGTPQNDEKLSVFSPKVLSIFPDNKAPNKKQLFSPTLLSFHNDGFFSMNEILSATTDSAKPHQIILDAVLEASGAGDMLSEVLGNMTSEIKHMDEVRFPLVREMSRLDLGHIRAQRSLDDLQRHELDTHGYTFFSKEQLDHIHASKSSLLKTPKFNIETYNRMSRDEKERLFEQEIREMANLHKDNHRRKRRRRAAVASGEAIEEGEHPGNGTAHEHVEHEEHEHEHHGGVEWITLAPTAFSNFINHGASMEVVTLSPRFWIAEILAPEALIISTLSPRAFIGTVLSPNALIARTLSPTAFRAEVLAPRALTAWVLSPEAFVVEVLSPRVLEPRVMSPEAFVIDILSPGILAPHYMSDEVIGVMVLSPNILSPRIESKEKMLVEILSPHILGGPHSKEEKEHGDVVEDKAGEHHDKEDPFHELEIHGDRGELSHPLEHRGTHAPEMFGVPQFQPNFFNVAVQKHPQNG
ncbi:unnamed protein product, partial [Mesorhabditis spiculigera]